MTQHDIHVRQGLPEEMQLLLRDYPRDAWPDHPNFAQSIQNWMGAHAMFRRLADLVAKDSREAIDKTLEPVKFAARLGHFGNLLIQNLHGHHGWEDHRFFPELEAADDRFSHGLEMLESDHLQMDAILDDLKTNANRYIQLLHLSETDAAEQVPAVLGACEGIQAFLNRHLTDEEDLVVPIILHHKLRG